MEFDKNGILNRAKAAQQTAAVMDEGLRAYMLKVYNYMATGILLTGIVALLTFKMSVVTNDAGSIVALTSIGNAISNAALVIFTGFSWLQLITSRPDFPPAATFSQIIFSLFIIAYGFAIMGSGFMTGNFAKKYGRIRVITFMLLFFTIMIYVPILYNFVSIILFVLLFPFYYAFITELLKVMPQAGSMLEKEKKAKKKENFTVRRFVGHFK